MRRLLAVIVVCALSSSPLFATGARSTQGTASLAGIARNNSGQALGNYTVRLRTLTMGQVVATTTSSAFGEYRFTGLEGGMYAVEVVNPAGQILGTSAVNVSSGASTTGVAVSATAPTGASAAAVIAALAGSAVAAGIGTATIGSVTAAAAAARVPAIANTRPRPSPVY
jgi:hypothetical protein